MATVQELSERLWHGADEAEMSVGFESKLQQVCGIPWFALISGYHCIVLPVITSLPCWQYAGGQIGFVLSFANVLAVRTKQGLVLVSIATRIVSVLCDVCSQMNRWIQEAPFWPSP